MRDSPLTVRSTGESVSAVYGLANTLLSVMQELKPSHVIVTLDMAEATLRHKQSADYKAHRVAMADDLRDQLARCRELIEAFGMPIYEHPDYEADDLMGTLSVQAADQNVETFLVSLDSDIAQLVRDKVYLWMYRLYQRDYVLYQTPEDVKERYGVLPEQMPDLKALKGDASDNIAGVPGVGEKTAIKLIQTFGSIEAIFENIEAVDPAKLRENLRAHEAQVRNSKSLATIVLDVPVTLDLATAEFMAHYDYQRAMEFCRKLEFRSLIARLPQAGGPMQTLALPQNGATAKAAPDAAVKIVRNSEDLELIAQRLQAEKAAVLDVQTSSPDPLRSQLIGIGLLMPDQAYYVPVGHVATDQLAPEAVLERLGPLFEDEDIAKTGHDLKFDVLALAQHGCFPRGLHFDTMIAAFLLGEGGGNNSRPGEGGLNLRWLASRRLGLEMEPPPTGNGRNKQLPLVEVAVEDAGRQAAEALRAIDGLAKLFDGELERQGMHRLFHEIEMPLVAVLARMGLVGVAIDTGALRELSVQLGEEIRRLEEEICANAGHQFNIGSPLQLSQVLFEELSLPKTRRLKSGGYTTDAQAMEAMRGLHPIIDLIFEYRELTKLKSTYLDTLPGLVDPRSNRLHTDFNQTGAATGRLSSSNPNLQNIPVRTERGGQVRRAFIARDIGPDPLLLSADYSQVELRIMAHITGDPALVQAFMQDEDIHAATASQVFNVPLTEVTSAMRRRAKVFNFGVLYGLSEYGLSVREKMSREEAGNFIRTYFEKYPGIQQYVQETVQRTREMGYAETLFGRRRYFPEITSNNANVRQAAERQAINMPVQGTAADIIKIAMNRLDEELEGRQLRAKMTLQVHDELIFECPREELEEVRALALDIMPRSIEMKVPLKIDTKVGKTWGEMN